MGLIQSNIGIWSDMDVLARLGVGASGSDPLSRSVHFDFLCAARITSCYSTHDYKLMHATQSVLQQQVAEDKVIFHLKYDESKETSPAGRW